VSLTSKTDSSSPPSANLRVTLPGADTSLAMDMQFPFDRLQIGEEKGRLTLGWAYLRTGMPERGLAELERAVSLAPDSSLFLGQLGQALAMTGRSRANIGSELAFSERRNRSA